MPDTSSSLSVIALLGYLVIVDLTVLFLYVLLGFFLAQTMPATYAILRRNFTGYFNNPTGYVFLIVFVILTCAAAFCTDEFFNTNLANLDQLNYWLPAVLLVFIPSITMSIWAQEQQQGTDELLLTLPATDFDVVLGKYLAAVGIYTVSLLFSHASNFTVLAILSEGDVDLGLFTSTYIGYWFVGLAMLSLGMVCSFLTSNLTIAFISGAMINAPFALASVIGTTIPGLLFFVTQDSAGTQAFTKWGYYEQFASFGRGVISLGSVVYFLMITVTGIYLSLAFLGQRHWATPRSGKDELLRIGLGYGLTAFRYLILLLMVVGVLMQYDLATVAIGALWIALLLGLAYLFVVSKPEAPPMLEHHFVRFLTLVLIMIGVSSVLSTRDIRFDLTQGRISSLSPETVKLIEDLDGTRPVIIEAYIGNKIPEPYVKTRYDLITMLNGIQAVSGGKVQVRINENLEISGETADKAEKHYDIKPETIRWMKQGVFQDDNVLLGVAFRCGLQRNVIPFFNNGVPVEYELARSITSVAKEKKKKLGVLKTDAEIGGGFDMQRMSPRPKQAILDELAHQYVIEDADPNASLLDKEYDVLLAVQPSSLNPTQMENFIAAVEAGIPTAIFEDPAPNFIPSTTGTDQQKRPRGGGMFGQQQPPEQKGDIRKLFKILGINFVGDKVEGKDNAEIIWQHGMPYPKAGTRNFPDQFVFVTKDQKPLGDNVLDPFNPKHPIVAGMHEVLLPFPGAIQDESAKGVTFTPLLVTGQDSGKLSLEKLQAAMSDRSGMGAELAQGNPSGKQWVLAAALVEDEPASDAKDDDKSKKHDKEKGKDKKDDKPAKKYGGMKVVVVADADVMTSIFFQLRARPDPDAPINWHFQNVPFVLNTIDWLAGDNRFLAIRNRETRVSTLRLVERATQGAWTNYNKEVTAFQTKFTAAKAQKQKEMKAVIEKLQAEADELQKSENTDPAKLRQLVLELAMTQQQKDREFNTQVAAFERDRARQTERIDRQRDAEISAVKSGFRFWSLLLPPIPAILIGVGVYIYGLVRENMTAPAARMKQ